jgi:hypothetical protein
MVHGMRGSIKTFARENVGGWDVTGEVRESAAERYIAMPEGHRVLQASKIVKLLDSTDARSEDGA